jgi:hypothetical protein
MVKADCQRFLKARGKLEQLTLQESPSHPSWQVGALFAQGQLTIQIQRTGFVTWCLTNPRKA